MPETPNEIPTLKLSPRAYLLLQSDDGSKEARIDVYEAHSMLIEAGRQPTEEKKWEYIAKWIAERLGCELTSLGRGSLYEFNDTVVALANKRLEERKKKLQEIAS